MCQDFLACQATSPAKAAKLLKETRSNKTPPLYSSVPSSWIKPDAWGRRMKRSLPLHVNYRVMIFGEKANWTVDLHQLLCDVLLLGHQRHLYPTVLTPSRDWAFCLTGACINSPRDYLFLPIAQCQPLQVDFRIQYTGLPSISQEYKEEPPTQTLSLACSICNLILMSDLLFLFTPE